MSYSAFQTGQLYPIGLSDGGPCALLPCLALWDTHGRKVWKSVRALRVKVGRGWEATATSLSQLEQRAPALAKTQLVKHAAAVRRGDYLSALESLHKYFDCNAGGRRGPCCAAWRCHPRPIWSP
jgi:hypothetical protein